MYRVPGGEDRRSLLTDIVLLLRIQSNLWAERVAIADDDVSTDALARSRVIGQGDGKAVTTPNVVRPTAVHDGSIAAHNTSRLIAWRASTMRQLAFIAEYWPR